jgi:hypothetical protein
MPTRNIPLALDDELLAAIDAVAEATKESRSAVMRRAIREGLPIVRGGGSAEVLVLDSATSREVQTASNEAKVDRTKFIIEAIRTGLQATYFRMMRDYWIREQDQNPRNKDAQSWVHTFEHSMLTENPTGREVRSAMRARGAALNRFWDLCQHVPEAFERFKLVEKLIQLRTKRGGYRAVWGCGLSTAEVRWQIEMYEKYEGDIPADEAAKHKAEMEKDEPARMALRDEVVDYMSPPYAED